MIRKWDVSTKETRRKCIDEVLTRIEEQDGHEFGMLAAEEIIDIVAQNIGPDIYNLGIRDAKKLLQDRFADIDIDLDMLESKS